MPIVTNGISTDIPAQTGVNTRLMRIVCTDDLATITTPGYLNPNDLEGYIVMQYDFFHIYYGSNSSSFGIFSVLIDPNTGVVTLNQLPASAGAVTLSGASVVGHLAKFSNTTGQVVDSGYKILSGVTTTYGGGGTSNAFTVPGMVAGSAVIATIATSSNAVSVVKAIPTTNTLTISFSADPGAGTTVNYIATTAPAV